MNLLAEERTDLRGTSDFLLLDQAFSLYLALQRPRPARRDAGNDAAARIG